MAENKTITDQTTMPLVSVMMPVYNGEKTIELAIKSLLMQTYSKWICIIVNDCSTDGTFNILNRYQQDKRFKIIHLAKNGGRGAARQIALENAEGKYLAYLDADDFYHLEKLEKQVKFLERNSDIALITCGQGSFDNKYILWSVRAKGINESITFEPVKGLVGSFAGSMIRMQNAKYIRYNLNLKASEDRDFFSRYLSGNKYSIFNEVLYYYFEIGTATARKILFYQLESLKEDYYLSKNSFIMALTNMLKRLLKIIVLLLVLPIFGADYIVKRRGAKPLPIEIDEYKNTLAIINLPII